MDKYGKEFVTLMVCENGKIVVGEEFGKVRTEFNKTFTDATNQATTLVDTKTKELDGTYNTIKNDANKIPGALTAL